MTEKEFIKRLGKRILEKREAQGLSREVFAKEIGISRMQLYRVEVGDSPTNVTVLFRMAKELGITVSDLMKI